MRVARPSLQSRRGLRLAIFMLAAGLAGCADVPEPRPAPDATGMALPRPAESGSPLPAAGRRPVRTAGDGLAPLPAGTAILLSARQPAYESVARELEERLTNTTVYDLSDDSRSPAHAFRQIGDSDATAIVAIGMKAAQSAAALARVPVVFCQVFNYRDPDVRTDGSRGVAALVPLDAHLAAWKRANPSLKRVGTVLGSGHELLLEEAQMAADRHEIELSIAVVRSDQEAQYEFRRIVGDIDGFWLFPDNRILSSRTLHEILTQAQRRQVEVAVSNEALLSLGASISVSSVPEDIATTVIGVLRRIEAGQLAELPELTPLSAARVVSR